MRWSARKERCSSMLVCTGSKGVRHGDGVVEVDGVRCMEMMDNVCATAALTEQREKYMVLVEVVHFFCAAAAALLLVCARTSGRQTDEEQVSEHESERALSWKVPRCCVRDARRAASPSAWRGGEYRERAQHFSRGALRRSSKGRFEFE